MGVIGVENTAVQGGVTLTVLQVHFGQELVKQGENCLYVAILCRQVDWSLFVLVDVAWDLYIDVPCVTAANNIGKWPAYMFSIVII